MDEPELLKAQSKARDSATLASEDKSSGCKTSGKSQEIKSLTKERENSNDNRSTSD